MTKQQIEFSSQVIQALTVEFKRDALKVAANYTQTIRRAYDDGLNARGAVNRILWLKADRTVSFNGVS